MNGVIGPSSYFYISGDSFNKINKSSTHYPASLLGIFNLQGDLLGI